MGFLDSITEGAKAAFGGAKKAIPAMFKTVVDLSLAGFRDDVSMRNVGRDLGEYWAGLTQGVGGVGQIAGSPLETTIGNTKPLGWVNPALETAYSQATRVPKTWNLLDQAGEDQGQSWAMFHTDSWKRAWNASDEISLGQSVWTNARNTLGSGGDPDKYTLEGDLKDARGNYFRDPGSAQYWTSGGLDFLGRVVIDPTIVAGKGAQVARMKYIKPMRARDVQTGGVDKYLDSKRFERVESFIKKSDSSDDIRRRLLWDNADGANMAHILFTARNDPELLRTAVRMMHGDATAYDDMLKYNEEVLGKPDADSLDAADADAEPIDVDNPVVDWNEYDADGKPLRAGLGSIWNKNRHGVSVVDVRNYLNYRGVDAEPPEWKPTWPSEDLVYDGWKPGEKVRPYGADPSDVMEATATAGRMMVGKGRPARLQRVGTSWELPGDWDTYQAQLQAQTDTLLQAAPFDPEIMDQVRYGLVSPATGTVRPQMRASLTSGARVSIHNALWNGSSPAIVRRLGQAFLTPSNRRVRYLDFDDADSDRALRTVLERGAVDAETSKGILSRYMATAPGDRDARQLIASEAESAVIRAAAQRHGMTPKDAEKIIALAARQRQRANAILNTKHEFASEGLQSAVAQRSRDRQQIIDDADGMTFSQGDDGFEGALARLDDQIQEETRGAMHTYLDENGVTQAVDAPWLESQLAPRMAVVDPRSIDRILKTHGSTIKRMGMDFQDSSSALFDQVMRLWKIGTLVGFAWPVRALSDEVARHAAYYGVAATAMNTFKGSGNAAANAWERGARAWDKHQAKQYDVLSRALIEKSPDPTQRFLDLNDAFAQGQLSVADLTAATESAYKRGMADDWTSGEFAAPLLNKELLNRRIVERALNRAEMDWFASPQRQRDFFRQVEEDGGLELNPLTGEAPVKSENLTDLSYLDVRMDASGRPDINDFYRFVHGKMDAFLRGGYVRAEVTDEGRVRLFSVGDREALAGTQTAQKQWTRFGATGNRMAAKRGVDVSLGDGRVARFEGAMAGADGYRYQTAASSAGFHTNAMLDGANTDRELMADAAGWDAAIKHDSPDYAAAWERAVNLQLGKDRAARQFMAQDGYDLDEDAVVDWAYNNDEGKAWARATRSLGSIEDRVARVRMMVDTYLPVSEGYDPAVLRRKALSGSATHADLHLVAPDSVKPTVHGQVLAHNLGSGPVNEFIRKKTDRMMEVLGSMPSDKASRFPFFNDAYKTHLQELVNVRWGSKGGTSEIRQEDLNLLRDTARRRAIADVRKLLFNADAVSEGTTLMRHLAPFAAAWQDSLRAWTGIMFREKPQSLGYLWNASQAPERSGLITDREGRELRMEGGKEVWYEVQYEVDPETGERTETGRVKAKGPADHQRYVSFMLPSWASPDSFGEDVRVPVSFSKDTLNTFMQFHPLELAGPVVQIPTSEFVKHDVGIKHSDSYLVKKVLPFGPAESAWKQILPNEVRSFVETYRGEDDTVFRNTMMGVYQNEVIRYNLGERSTKPTWEEAGEKASDLKTLRALATFTLPVPLNFSSPYQPYVDAYRQIRAEDPMNADQKFYEQFGEEYFILTARVTKTTGGIPSTMKGYEARKKYQGLIEKYPDLSGVIAGDVAGPFSKAVYEWEKAKGYRTVLSPEDSVKAVNVRLGYLKYNATMDALQAEMDERGLTSWNDSDAEDLSKVRSELIDSLKYNEDGTLTDWFVEHSTTNRAAMESRLIGLREIASDKRLLGRDDIRGLAEYLLMRDEFVGELQYRADTDSGPKSITAEDNIDLYDQWQIGVSSILSRNLSFAPLYYRYLELDEPKAA